MESLGRRFMLRMTPLILIAVANTFAFGEECKVDVLLKATRTDFASSRDRSGIDPRGALSIVFLNTGKSPVVLVEPGDGSWSTVPWRRTPIVYWEVERGNSFALASPTDGGGCGNRNALRAEEVFELLPGQSRALGGWIPQVLLDTPGTYRVRFHYVNVPGFNWTGGPLGSDDEVAMSRVRGSAPCDLVSNAVEVRIRSSQREK